MKILVLALRCDRLPLRALFIAACGMGLTFIASKTLAASPVGLWYAEGGAAEVQVFPCADEFCGRVIGLRSPLGEDGCELRDDKNPDSALRNRAIIGLLVLTGLKPIDDDQAAWSGGSIYDPASGHTYSCIARLEGNDRLFLRGYFGIQLLGRTTTWNRVGATQCQSVNR